MAINNPAQPTQTATESNFIQPTAQPTGTTFIPPAQQTPNTSFFSGGIFAAPLGRSNGSATYAKLKADFTEIFKGVHSNIAVSIIDLDNANFPALLYSCIVIALSKKDEPNLGVAFHILALEGTGEKIPNAGVMIGNKQIEIMRAPCDAVDDVLIKLAKDRIAIEFPNKTIHYADGCIIPASFNAADQTMVEKLAMNVALACSTELAIASPTFRDFNLSEVTKDTLLAEISVSRQQTEDILGNPIRSDVAVRFSSKRSNAGPNKYTSVNAGDKDLVISQISGFVDLVWNPLAPQNTFNYYPTQQNAPSQKFAARLCITDLSSEFTRTPAGILLALSTAFALRDDNNWIQVFRPSATTTKEVDRFDIGALNIEGNTMNDPSGIGERVITKSDNFTLQQLGMFVGALIQPGIMVSLDCPEVAPQSWYLNVFAAASSGSPGARRVIIDSANALTNGNFSKHFQDSSPIFVDINNRVHLGYFVDRNGVKQDIRGIDYLAVANIIGERDVAFLKDFSDTYLRTEYPIEQRLDARKKMIMAITDESAVFNGYAQRVTFSNAFLMALALAVKETGVDVRVSTPLSSSDFSNNRGVGSFSNAALMAPGSTFANSGAFGFTQQSQYRHTSNEWRFS